MPSFEHFFEATTPPANITIESVKPRRPQGPAGSHHSDICQWCFHPFDYVVGLSGKHRSSVEYEQLRKTLKIAEARFDPVVCEGCFDYVIGSANQNVERPGSDNSRPSNLLLRSYVQQA